MKFILTLAAAGIMLANAPATAGQLADGTRFTQISPSVIMIGTPAPKAAPKAVDNKFGGFAAKFPVTALLDDPAVAALSLDTIIGKTDGTGVESAIPTGLAMQDKPETAEPVKAAVSMPVMPAPKVPQMAEAPTPSPHPDLVAIVPPVAMDEETSSIGSKADTAPVKLFEDEGIRTGD